MNLTYLLGAGASANTYPVVDSMADHLTDCLNFGEAQSEPLKPKLIMDSIGNLSTKVARYGTPDTAARALQFAGMVTELENLRRDISVFFSTYRSVRYLQSKGKPSEEPIDKRFLNLIAALGESEEKALIPNNINILTYNYDCLLEEGICAMQVKNTDWFDSKRGIKPWPWKPEITEDTNIFHLNGIAGFGSHSDDKEIQFIQEQSDVGDKAMHSKILHDVNSTLERIENGEYDNPRFSEHIKFAWEVAENEPEAVEEILQIMRETDFLVVIGYSFPYFNRSLDRLLFEGLMNSNCREITVVDQEYDVENLTTLFQIDRIVSSKNRKTINDTTKFYIPPDYDIR